MKTEKKPLSIKVIYWITNITFWIYVAVAIFAVGISIALMFNFFNNDLQLHVGIPVSIDILEKGELVLNNISSKVQLVEMSGKIHLINTPGAIGQVYSIFILTIVSLFFYIFLTFKKFITNVYKGVYFDIDNIYLLKKISYVLVGIWAFTVFYAYFQYYYLMQNIKFNTVEVSGEVNIYSSILLVALFIWVLSHIFMKGCELQDENNFTI